MKRVNTLIRLTSIVCASKAWYFLFLCALELHCCQKTIKNTSHTLSCCFNYSPVHQMSPNTLFSHVWLNFDKRCVVRSLFLVTYSLIRCSVSWFKAYVYWYPAVVCMLFILSYTSSKKLNVTAFKMHPVILLICSRFQSKIEYDRLIALIGKKPAPEAGTKVRWRGGGISLAQRRDFIQQLQSLTGEAPTLPMELNPKEFQGFHLALLNKVRLDCY